MCVHQYQKINERRYTRERVFGGGHRTVELNGRGGRTVRN